MASPLNAPKHLRNSRIGRMGVIFAGIVLGMPMVMVLMIMLTLLVIIQILVEP